MDWNDTGEENRKALRRVVALLLALAALAELASGRSRPVRRLVLWLLRPAEEIARDFVSGLTWSAADPPARVAIALDADRADAMRLALSFRALAAALATLTAGTFASSGAGMQILSAALAESAAGALAALGDRAGVPAVEGIDSS